MKELLFSVTETSILIIDAIALLAILAGTLQAVVQASRSIIARQDRVHMREIWLQYSRWLVAALTFQLAADIIESSIRASWEDIAKLGAVAVIRTFLNYFLERDQAEMRESLGARVGEKRAEG
jgi:uncharacterized membrane protein